MYCTKCGTQLPEGENVCPKCSDAKKPEIPTENNPIMQELITPTEINAEPEYNPNPQPQANNFGAAQSYNVNNSNAAPQQPAGAPVYQTFNQYQQNQPKQVVTTGQWILRMLINLIPCVGPIIYLIMLFIWANDKTKEETSANWAKAQLIWIAISIGIALIGYIIFFAVVGLSLDELFNDPYQYDVII